MKCGCKKVLKQLHGSWFINSNCHVWILSDGWSGPSFLTSVFSLSSGDQLPKLPLSEVFPTTDLGNILNHFSHTWTCLFLVGFAPFLVLFLCGPFLFFVVMGVTVDRSQSKQGENDKSQQDESYFKVCEGELHQLLLLCWFLGICECIPLEFLHNHSNSIKRFSIMNWVTQ